jgi:hypothetical protein
MNDNTVEIAAKTTYDYIQSSRPEDHGPYKSWDETPEHYRAYLRSLTKAGLESVMGDRRFDFLCKTDVLAIGNFMEVGGTMYVVSGLGFSNHTVEIILRQHEDPLEREIVIRADSDQVFGVWNA